MYGDFDADGFDDIAIGVPGESVDGASDAGAVQVIYGSPFGPLVLDNQLWTQNSPGVLGAANGGEEFGSSLAIGDYNGDGYDDLAVGAPDDSPVGTYSGAVNVLYGSASGLSAASDQYWHQNSPGVLREADAWNDFGWALAAGDFDGDGRDDLAIGDPRQNLMDPNFDGLVEAWDTGIVQVLYGSSTGLTATGDQVFAPGENGIAGLPEQNEQFGSVLTTGDFDGNGRDDLAVGVWRESVGFEAHAGAVNVIYGSASGLQSAGNHILHQNVAGVLNSAEQGDEFGRSLAAGDFDGDGREDVAVGVPGENDDRGAVQTFYGTAGGLSAAGNQLWTQNSSGIHGDAEDDDRFGESLASGDFNGNGRDDLAIGVPGEAVNSVSQAGAVNVIFGSANGLTSVGNQIWHQDNAQLDDQAEEGDLFGASLRGGDLNGDGRDDLVVGVPSEDRGGVMNSGAVDVLFGSASGLTTLNSVQFQQNSSGILGTAEDDDWFGML